MIQDAPGLVGDVARWIDSCARHPAPVLSTAAALVTCSALAGRRYECSGARGPIYVIGVARSGVGKDTGRRCAAGLLAAAECKERIGTDDVASAAGVIARLSKCPTQLFLLDEFGRMLEAYTSKNAGGHERQIITTFMKLWSSASDSYFGKAYAERDSHEIIEPACVLYGTTTPEVFYRSLRGSDVVDGVLSRMLLIECEHGQMPAVVPTGKPSSPPADLVERANRVARGRVEGNVADIDSKTRANCTELLMTDEARAGFDRISVTVRPLLDGPQAELWVRAREQALRLALVVAVGCESVTVEREHLAWAWKFVRWCTQRACKIVKARVADTEEGQCELAIRSQIEASPKGVLTKAEITRAVRRWPSRMLTDALRSLVDSRIVIDDSVPTPGRVTKTYRLAVESEIADNPWDEETLSSQPPPLKTPRPAAFFPPLPKS